MNPAASTTLLLSLCLPTLAVAQNDFAFQARHDMDLAPGFEATPTARALGDLDGDALPDVVAATQSRVGVLMGPGHYTVHEMIDNHGREVDDLAILENYFDSGGSTLFRVGGGTMSTFRYDPADPDIVEQPVIVTTDATKVDTWSADYSPSWLGFVAIAESNSVRVMAYSQHTGAYFADAFIVNNVQASDIALIDIDGNVSPELVVFDGDGAHLYFLDGRPEVDIPGDFSSVGDTVVLRHPADPVPRPEVLVWTVYTAGRSYAWQISQGGLEVNSTLIFNAPTTGVAGINYDSDGLTDVLALAADGKWQIGRFDDNAQTIAWGVFEGQIAPLADLGPPMVADFDGDGDSDLLTMSRNEDPTDEPAPELEDLVDDGPDVLFHENVLYDANRKRLALRGGSITPIGFEGGGEGNGPSAIVDAVNVKFQIDPPEDVANMTFSHVGMRFWKGAGGPGGTKYLLVEAGYEQGMQLMPADPVTGAPDWPSSGLVIPASDVATPGSTTGIVEDLSISTYGPNWWEVDATIPSEELMYFELRCVDDPGGPNEHVYPSRFFVLYLDDDAVPELIWDQMLDWHHPDGAYQQQHMIDTASTVGAFGFVPSGERVEPLPEFFELTGVSLRICGYPVPTN